MLERDAEEQLDGRVEMDDAYLGGAKSGGKRGRGSAGKTPFVAAVETTDDGKPKRIQLRRVRRFTKKAIKDHVMRRGGRQGLRVWRRECQSARNFDPYVNPGTACSDVEAAPM